VTVNHDQRLDGIHLFEALAPDERRAIERQCVWRRFGVNDNILDQDSEDRDVYFVVRGTVQVVNYSMGGRKIALARIPAGSYFGELAAIDAQPRSANVVAAADCLVATMTPQLFNQLIVDHPALAKSLLLRLARIVRACDNRIMDLSTLGAVQRVCLELLQLASPDPGGSGGWVVWPLPTQKEIASQASTTRETVARAIGQLAAAGVVERKGKSLYIRDRSRLEEYAAAVDPDHWSGDTAR
jgi:CRP-like cAMP-binding protein